MRAASERTEPIKSVTMEEVVRRENLKKVLFTPIIVRGLILIFAR